MSLNLESLIVDEIESTIFHMISLCVTVQSVKPSFDFAPKG